MDVSYIDDPLRNRRMTRLEWAVDRGLVSIELLGKKYKAKRNGSTKIAWKRRYYWAIPVVAGGVQKLLTHESKEGEDYWIGGAVPPMTDIIEGLKT